VKLRCPACGQDFSLDAAVKDRDLDALVKMAAQFGLDWPLVSEYLDCFRFRRDGALAVKKRLRLAREVGEMWRTCKFSFRGEHFRIGLPELRESLAEICNRELLGLKNHNYLKTILVTAAQKTSQREERELKEKEGRLRAGEKPEEPAEPEPEALNPQVLEDPEWQAEFARLNRRLRQGVRDRVGEAEMQKRQGELKAHMEKAKGKEL
jgi:hypothetical protein